MSSPCKRKVELLPQKKASPQTDGKIKLWISKSGFEYHENHCVLKCRIGSVMQGLNQTQEWIPKEEKYERKRILLSLYPPWHQRKSEEMAQAVMCCSRPSPQGIIL